jgi:MinD superfamily P-loop ATPase
VTEPTPFGLSDLTLAVAAVEELKIPMGVVINRSDIGDREVRDFCRGKDIEVLMEIPFSRRIAEVYARGGTLLDAEPAYKEKLREIAHRIGEASD